jgi:hypothetical protein
MFTVKNLKLLKTLPLRNEVSEDYSMAFVEDEQKVYQYKNGDWVECPGPSGLNMSLLELNSMVVTQLPKLSKKDIEDIKSKIREYVSQQQFGFFMLLSNELKYYTVFDYTVNLVEQNIPLIEDEVIACLQELGTLKLFDKTQDNAWEAWITKDDKSYPLYFFDYTKGVIQCR